ncbi:MAG TPA: GNAT family N-acetyltransferase [Ktedonobacteraceae bacterium]
MGPYNYWEGERILLRAIEPEDQAFFHSFDVDSEANLNSSMIYFPRSQAGDRRWFEKAQLEEPENDEYRLIIELKEHGAIGSINAFGCNKRMGTFRYAIAIGREHWGKGYAKEAIRILLRYFFEELRYQKVTVNIYAFNERSIKLLESLGFQHEGRLRRMIYTGGQFHDEIYMGMTREEFADKISKL